MHGLLHALNIIRMKQESRRERKSRKGIVTYDRIDGNIIRENIREILQQSLITH